MSSNKLNKVVQRLVEKHARATLNLAWFAIAPIQKVGDRLCQNFATML
jgi:hypothetical protein